MASTPIDVGFASTNENLFGSLERMIRGCPLPDNVIKDVNPYNYMPSNLPDGVWYLVCSKENTSARHGRWKTKEEACEIFSNSFIIGWRSTLEFYEGQVPQECKTDWVMQEFRLTQKILVEDKKEEDSSSLCRVFLSGKRSPNLELQQKIFSTTVAGETQSHSTQLSFEKAKDDTRQDSTSRHEVNDDDETRSLALLGRPINLPEDNLPETDDFFEDDYLELLDLDQPVSPSSSSDSSTLSSDEYFDPSALLRELEPKKTEGVVPENSGYKYSFSTPHTPNKVVLSPGSLINVERSKNEAEETLKSECSKPGSATVNGVLDSKALKKAFQGQEADYGVEGPSSNSCNLTPSSHDHTALKNGERKAIVGGIKKLKRKYFCFMPF